MGWTSYRATYYKKNGSIDRKSECDAYFTEGLNRGFYKLNKSTMVGSVYYAAVTQLKRYKSFETEELEDIPESDQKTFAAIFLTSVDMKSYDNNFYYKDMSECCGPCETKCPESILKLLSPTDSQWALEWREACHRYNLKKKDPKALSNLPIGAVIEYTTESGKLMRLLKHEPAYQFKRPFWYNSERHQYVSSKHIPENYKVVNDTI